MPTFTGLRESLIQKLLVHSHIPESLLKSGFEASSCDLSLNPTMGRFLVLHKYQHQVSSKSVQSGQREKNCPRTCLRAYISENARWYAVYICECVPGTVDTCHGMSVWFLQARTEPHQEEQ